MRPPRLAHWLLERAVAPRLVDAIIGDLDELFAVESLTRPWRARAAYWQRTLGALWHVSAWRQPPSDPHLPGDPVMLTFFKDVVLGLRLFASHPSYAWAAVITLALAIGANTVIFSMANVLALKPLPIQQADRMGWILATGPGAAPDRAGISLPDYAVYRDGADTFARLAAWRRNLVTLRAGDMTDRVLSMRVIGDVQGLWGLRAARGRTLTASDEAAGAPRVLVLSHQAWATRFGSAPDVLSRQLIVDGEPHAVVGVLTADIELGNLSEIDVWLPEQADPATAARTIRGWRPVGLLAEGRTVGDAHAQVSTIAGSLADAYPDTNRDWTIRVDTTRSAMGGTNTWLVLSMLSLITGLLLLLACANVTNLLIARLIGRRQELAVRTALGATRARIVRQIVAESLVLGIAGGLLGLAVAAAGLQGVHAMASEPFFKQIGFDARVILFATGLALVAPLIFTVLPTLRVLRRDVRPALNEATLRSVGAGSRGRSALVVLQVALAVTLAVVSSLVVQSVRALTQADLGYDPSRLLAAQIDVPTWKFADESAARRLRQRLVERVREIPGVQAATLATEIPSLHFASPTVFEIVGRPSAADRDRPSAGLTITSTDYFRVTGIPLVAGRVFEAADRSSPSAVAVVSAETARRYWPGGAAEAVGSAIRLPAIDGRPALEATVIGVARDTANPDLDQVMNPMLFLLDDHRPARATHIVLSAAAPARLAADLRQAIRDVDPDLPAAQLRTVAEGFADETSSSRLLGALFAAFAIVAVLLATAGLYGVVSYSVSQRTPEIAVRMALGASAREIARQVVGGSLKLAALGIVFGLGGAFVMAQAIAAILFGVSASDPATYAAAATVALAAAVVASWIPMRRAATVDPIQSLRQA
jgi:putative ABC transport system permease protein